MCPSVSGITTTDAALSTELGMRALEVAVGSSALGHMNSNIQMDGQSKPSACAPDGKGVLRPGGHLVIKLLESEDAQGRLAFDSVPIGEIFSLESYCGFSNVCC